MDAPASGEQLADQLALQFVVLIPKPFDDGGVGPDDAAIRARDEMTAGRVIPQVVKVGVGHADRTKAEMASAVASGSLTCGQWPVASNVSNWLSGMCW